MDIPKVFIQWPEIKARLDSWDKTKKYYGVTRGGCAIAAYLGNPVDMPEQADFIVDDLVDSGKTMRYFERAFPNKPFYALIDKQKEFGQSTWVVFPWENADPPEDETLVTRLLQYLGEDPTREGLLNTPTRVSKFYKEFLNYPEVNYTTFDSEGMDQMIIEKDIPFYSLCEHHMLPFFGKAIVAYIPNGKILGLSKMARCVQYFAGGLQNQERITQQVCDKINEVTHAEGVAVIIEAEHLCQSMRGARTPGAKTVTSAISGNFQQESTRMELLNLIRSNA